MVMASLPSSVHQATSSQDANVPCLPCLPAYLAHGGQVSNEDWHSYQESRGAGGGRKAEGLGQRSLIIVIIMAGQPGVGIHVV